MMEPTVNPTSPNDAASSTTTTQEPTYDAPRNNSTVSESSLTGVTNGIANVAGSSIREAKNRLTTVTSNESVLSVWEQVRWMATGRNGEEGKQVDTSPTQDEVDLIDSMDNEKIAEFLREKNRSDGRRPRKR
ncbi:hypothetical protein BDV23DRAFT_134675 [Aspergillus alliaceus]|uniref:Uncharacterized protein n=1 Tax=Petromyces alliaceus TaxID=209559 RepID=A0A5N7CLC4_PETAA|nr:hypothetical protein BDV23DRAFT_134675 [Aspergillus alliaceus]